MSTLNILPWHSSDHIDCFVWGLSLCPYTSRLDTKAVLEYIYICIYLFFSDRRHGADLEQEIDEGVEKMMNYISALRAEIKDRTLLIEILDLSEAFYENQRGEAKVVCNVSVIFNLNPKVYQQCSHTEVLAAH